jgi:hypothetical protein
MKAVAYACGIGFMSVATNVVYMDRPDPTGVSGVTAVIVKTVMLGLGLAGLLGALGRSQQRTDDPRLPFDAEEL